MTCPHCNAPNADDARFCGSCGRATSATEPTSNPQLGEAPVLIGREIAGRYRMLAKLGEGGMGAVYKAEQMSLKRTVAVKLLRPEVASSPMLLRRFNAEAEAVAKLSHPNTVNIYDFGQDSDGTLFIAMEYIEGTSLRSVIHHDAPLPLPRALAIAIQVASSLSDAHANAIVHRDLKPDNVMLQERGRQRDVVRVLDFGIAKLRDENRQSQMAMTQAGDMLGTPQYMAPEQIRAEQIDGRTDVYALGCMLYEMVTARLPYEAPTVMSLLSKHLLEITVPPSQRRPDLGLPPAFDHLVLAAMAKDPKVRPPTMEVFGEQLAALLATLPGGTGQSTSQQLAAGTGASPTSPTAPAMIPTPPAYSAAPAGPPPPGAPAAGAPSTPPEAPSSAPPFAPPVAPPFAPPPAQPPVGHAPSLGGYQPPPPGAPPYDPHPGPAHDTGSIGAPPARRGSPAMWVALGVLVLGGAGAGIYVGVVRSSSTTPEVVPVPGDAAAGETMDRSNTPAEAGPAADPWSSSGGTTLPPIARDVTSDPDDPDPDPDPDVDASAGATPVMQGLKIRLPSGFKVNYSRADAFLATNRANMAIGAFPILDSSDDFQALAQTYAKESGLMLMGTDEDVIAGKRRPLAIYQGKVKGAQVMQLATALIGASYRVAVVVQIPVTAGQQDPAATAAAILVLQNGLYVP